MQREAVERPDQRRDLPRPIRGEVGLGHDPAGFPHRRDQRGRRVAGVERRRPVRGDRGEQVGLWRGGRLPRPGQLAAVQRQRPERGVTLPERRGLPETLESTLPAAPGRGRRAARRPAPAGPPGRTPPPGPARPISLERDRVRRPSPARRRPCRRGRSIRGRPRTCRGSRRRGRPPGSRGRGTRRPRLRRRPRHRRGGKPAPAQPAGVRPHDREGQARGDPPRRPRSPRPATLRPRPRRRRGDRRRRRRGRTCRCRAPPTATGGRAAGRRSRRFRTGAGGHRLGGDHPLSVPSPQADGSPSPCVRRVFRLPHRRRRPDLPVGDGSAAR